jgi:hypothetical protein
MHFEHTFLLLLQALCLVVAAVGLALTDWSLHKQEGWSKALLQLVSHLSISALCVLWLTALLTIWRDTGFDWATVLASRKAVIGIALAGMLSLNGVFLLRCLRDTLQSGPSQLIQVARRASKLAQACGAAWLIAGYFALTRTVTEQSSLSGWALAIAALLVLAAVGLSRQLQPALPSMAWRRRAN